MAEISFKTGFPDDRDTHNAVLEIYHLSFPENERQPDAVILERCSNGLYELHIGWVNNQLTFIALLWPLQGTSFILLDYMATHPAYKGKKIASQFLTRMQVILASRQLFFILETEDPATGSNKTKRAQRLSFYRKNNAQELQGVKYTLPSLQGTITTAMLLLIFPAYFTAHIQAVLVKNLIVQIYKELYHLGEQEALAGSSGYEHNEAIAML